MKKATSLFFVFFFLSIQLILAQSTDSDFTIGKQFILKSKANNYEYNIAVYLPTDYSEGQSYPSLYLFLGRENMFHATTGMVRLMSDQGQIPGMIVVGITNISWWTDLTPEKLDWREETGGAKEFLSFVSDQLIPEIDQRYITTDHRIYMGHSLGGMFGIYALIEEESLFDDFVLISPSIAERGDLLFEKLEEKVKESKNFQHDIYMTMGNEANRIARSLHKVSTAFTLYEGNNLNWKMKEMDGHNHFTLMIPTIFEGLRFVCKNDQED